MTESLELGQIPPHLRANLICDPKALYGVWIEADKPLSQVTAILGKLGLSAVKRRIVARCHCKVEIEPGPDTRCSSEETLTLDNPLAGGSDAQQQSERTPLRVDDAALETSTAASTPLTQHKWGAGESYTMRQHFPMGRVRESTFVADGETEFEQEEAETDNWRTTVSYVDGVLIQKRVSDKLGVTMYDSRAVLSAPLELTEPGSGSLKGLPEDQPVLYFQWVVIDQKSGEVQSCRYYLARSSSLSSNLPSSQKAADPIVEGFTEPVTEPVMSQ